jgi:hypothetical protein
MEHYGEIEARIEKVLSAMRDDSELKCAEAARQFFVPYPVCTKYVRLRFKNYNKLPQSTQAFPQPSCT